MLSTIAVILAAGLLMALLGAAAGLWWMRRAMRRPVRVCAAPADGCDGCPSSGGSGPRFAPQLAFAAASGGGGSGGAGGEAPESRGPDRRTFLRGALGLSSLGAVGSFGAASIAFLWPDTRGGFGAVLEVGHVDDVLNDIDEADGAFEFTPGRARLVRYDPEDDTEDAYLELTQEGESPVLALYQVCPHLGCAVPWCDSSRWWECPCHASAYNRWGEFQDGPAPRGMDRFRVEISDDGILSVDTTEIIDGPSRGQQSLIQPREGDACV
ncbi:hypothetical protein ER308_12700 [Egibacter rhizosphaerae]|uniref:Cytochrome bc1 complex Rieske iron-sulfur subunit n=1 Tax=Egibacter rhizosphaerae TaxID=1670831 RepID=A0A411YGQ0_9ACTN|nr:Rieske 2Fe-2S domain-containing protein [Egibacter rhizosphaerae]QBI20339.1 hypothetical protein ER308_12700 [Egibacter rhizosphaerae]